jgi:hypothetical protein
MIAGIWRLIVAFGVTIGMLIFWLTFFLTIMYLVALVCRLIPLVGRCGQSKIGQQ